MKQFWKWTGIFAGLVALILIVAIAAITLLVDPNQFKPLIMTQFKQFTGFEVTIPGNLSWSFFPHFGMEAEAIEVKNPPAFSSKVKQVVLRMRIMPLLHGQLELSKVSIDEIQVNQLQATHLTARVQLKDQILHIRHLSADFYEGDVRNDTTIVLKPTPPTWHVVTDIRNVNMASLLTGLSAKNTAQKITFDGRGNITFDVTTRGKKTEELLSQLSGIGRFNLSKGVVKGVDIAFFVDTATALIDKQPLPTRSPTLQTEFGQLTGTAIIKNGVMNSNDVLLDSPLYTIKGKGSINLVDKTLDFYLDVTAKAGSSKTNNKILALYGKTIPIRVSGNVNDPSVNLDTLALMREIGKEQLQRVGQEIQKALPDKANKFLQSLFH